VPKTDQIKYREEQPDNLLADVVKCFWVCENLSDSVQTFTIIPDGYFDLTFRFQKDKSNKTTLTGLWTNQIEISIQAKTKIFGIRFKPLAVDKILKYKIAPIVNNRTDLHLNFWPFPKTDLKLLISDSTDYIKSRLIKKEKSYVKKQQLFQLLYDSNGSVKIEKLSKSINWSSRQMNRYFNDRFGVSLKEYCRVLRCKATYREILNGNYFPSNDFFDQSHFIKEIKKHTGETPKNLGINKNDRFLQLITMRNQDL
jgi:AraC-like DNA-binding protein